MEKVKFYIDEYLDIYNEIMRCFDDKDVIHERILPSNVQKHFIKITGYNIIMVSRNLTWEEIEASWREWLFAAYMDPKDFTAFSLRYKKNG